MPPPRLEDRKIVEIKKLKAQGKTIEEIVHEMDLQGMKVGRASVAKYAKKFDDLDRPFDWLAMESAGVPWAAGPYILSVWREAKIARRQANDKFVGIDFFPQPSVREGRWWWRVHLALPDISNEDVYEIAGAFAAREIAHDLLDKPLNTADLQAWVAWKPYESEEAKQSYNDEIKAGTIPEPVRNPLLPTENSGGVFTDKHRIIFAARSYDWPWLDHPHMLPSEADSTT